MQVKICKVRYGKILANLYFPGPRRKYYLNSKTPKRFLVFCYGLPGKPLDENSETVKKFLKNDFVVVCPEYIGTFSSYGKFYIENTIETVLKTIKFIRKGEARELWSMQRCHWKTKDITLIGGSFGGSVALVAGAKSRGVKNIIAISSPIDWREHSKSKKEENLEELYSIIKRGWENIWRIASKKNWQKFVSGKLDMNPVDYIKELRNKNIMLIHSQNDKVVSVQRSITLFQQLKEGRGKSELLILKNERHCSNNILAKEKVFKETSLFLKSRGLKNKLVKINV